MTGKSHLTINFSCAVAAANALVYMGWTYNRSAAVSRGARYIIDECLGRHSEINSLMWLCLAVAFFFVGTLLPDIDTPGSTISRILHFHLPIKHRTWTHTIWAVLLIAVCSAMFRPLMYMCFGYALHLFWDSLSAAGCCWLYPIQTKAKNHILKLYHTGHIGEYVLLNSVVVLTAVNCVHFAVSGIYTNIM